MRLAISILFGFILSTPSRAFLPPLAALLKEISESRQPTVEIQMKHQIRTPRGVVEIQERLLRHQKKLSFLWRVGGSENTVGAVYDRKAYVLSPDRLLPSRSPVFNGYFTHRTFDELRENLLQERFLRRDQLIQYKPGFKPEGDPDTWNVRDNYLVHDDVFLSRRTPVISIAVLGNTEGDRRTIYFDREYPGIRRLEWADSKNTFAWNFESFSNMSNKAIYPRRGYFDADGNVLIYTTFNVQYPSTHEVTQFLSQLKVSRSASLSGSAEELLRLLLNFR